MRTAVVNPLLPAGYDLVWTLVIATLAALAVVAALQVLRAKQLSGLEVAVWLLVIVALPVLGPVAWFITGRRLRASSIEAQRR
ncbi:PLDc N-terminal domain-containing protein [Agrococcus beijingensis]|uniref:PLDc N-terminal domain-containing protein n=1 Tax=Agrococcus beijingensis TaxID=3068634 RepID=UPI002742169D|nr:PLDc N-terminal domain-containing protein [Agrococcus sp. REN33]